MIPNEQYNFNTSFDEQMAKWRMSVSSCVRARVRERERERSERVKGQKEEEMYERKSIRDGLEIRERQIKGQYERKRRERRRLLLKGMSSLPLR